MRDFIEAEEAKRAAAIIEQGVKVGDFVQIVDWFADVWAEVVSVRIWDDETSKLRFSSVEFIQYSKDGMMRARSHAYLGRVRKVATADEVATKVGIVYSVNGRRGGFTPPVQWPTAAGPHTPLRGNGAIHHQEKHPDWRG